MSLDIDIRKFNGDYVRLSEIIHKAWPHEHQGFIDFTPGYLKFLIESPDTHGDLTLGAYKNDRLISFILSKKKRLEINGRNYKALLNTLSTTDPDEAKSFPYIKVRNRCIKKALENGYLLNYGFMTNKIKNYHIEQIFAQKRNFQTRVARSFGNYVFSITERKRAAMEMNRHLLREVRPGDIGTCMKISNQPALELDIRETRDWNNFRYLLLNKRFCFTFVYEKQGKVCAFVNGRKVKYIYAGNKQDVVSVTHLYFNNCTRQEREDFLKQLIASFKETNVTVISIPDTGARDISLLRSTGFIKMHFKHMQTRLYMTIFNPKKIAIKDNSTFDLEIL